MKITLVHSSANSSSSSGDTSPPALWFVPDTLTARRIVNHICIMNIINILSWHEFTWNVPKIVFTCSYSIFSLLNKITSVHDDRLVSKSNTTSIPSLSSVASQCSMLIYILFVFTSFSILFLSMIHHLRCEAIQ